MSFFQIKPADGEVIELQRLEDPLCRGPNEKAAVLVTAHNVIVGEYGFATS